MKNFIITFFISSAALLSICIGLITAIDPYDKLGNNFFGFETKAVAQSRENKFYMLEASKKNYTAFILGSSAAHRYPTQKVNELTGLTTYNYAVQHSTAIDYLAIVKHITEKAQPKLIILQLDFIGLDDNYRVDNRLFNSPLKKYLKKQKKIKTLFDNTNFTLDALRDSFRVIFVNKFGKARHIYLEDGNYIEEKPIAKPIKIRQGSHSNFKFSFTRIEILKKIKQICKKNNIKLIVVSSPLSLDHISLIKNNPISAKAHNIFLKEMTTIFGVFWDFQNETMKKYNDHRYFLDSTHPTKLLSSLILEKVLKGSELELGKKHSN